MSTQKLTLTERLSHQLYEIYNIEDKNIYIGYSLSEQKENQTETSLVSIREISSDFLKNKEKVKREALKSQVPLNLEPSAIIFLSQTQQEKAKQIAEHTGLDNVALFNPLNKTLTINGQKQDDSVTKIDPCPETFLLGLRVDSSLEGRFFFSRGLFLLSFLIKLPQPIL